MTDITGYSLLGHGYEMAKWSQTTLQIQFGALRWYPGALDYGAADIFPGGMQRNREYFSQWVQMDAALPLWQQKLLFDPQTSGGLLMAVAADDSAALLAELLNAGEAAAHIGQVVAGSAGLAVLA
jgi:selenide,water dikinase